MKMGEVSVNSTGLLPKISSLLNNPLFSDIEFVFINDSGEIHKIFGHKLILALRSKNFAYQFFEKGESTSTIRLPASKKTSFELLFRFLYTDDVQFHTYEEAQDLYDLANQYDIEELPVKCYKYMVKDRLTISNLFHNYDCALKKNISMLLKDCREFVCSQTRLVLKSQHFFSAPPEVIEDIIKLDDLFVSSELEVITAVLNWGTEDLKKKDILCDEQSLRKHINRFMKHLRFLTLSSSEFDSFVENYDILSAKESNVLTKKMLQPQCNVNFPEGICCIANKRRTANIASIMDNFCLDSKYRNADSPKSVTPDSNKSFYLGSAKSVFDEYKSTVPDSPSSVVSDSPKSVISDYRKSVVSDSRIGSFFPKHAISDSPKSMAACSPSFEVKKCSASEQIISSYLKPIKSSSNFSPALFTLGSVSTHSREYSFPLEEIPPCFGLSFRKDINCSVTFKMIRGNIFLRGFELKIKNESHLTGDELEVVVYVKGFSEPFDQTYKKKLHNNSFLVMFPKPVVLREGNKGELEVSIENLLLNRCSVCYNVDYEMNNGLHFAAELYLKSNQKNDGFLFLIDKLLYN